MPGAQIISIKNASVKFAATQAGLATAPDFTCQVISAAINAVPNLQTVPATYCEGQTQVPAVTGWQLALTWLQDFGAAGSMSQYMFDNDATLQWFSITPTNVGSGLAVPAASGQCYVVAGAYMGAAGAPLQASATCPVPTKPVLTPAVAATGATAGTPGTWTPAGSIPPATLAGASGVTASPTTAWTTGQSVVTGDGTHIHWDSSAWVTGNALAADAADDEYASA
jgi:hypothetical protein